MKRMIPAALLLLTLISLPGCGLFKSELIVGKDIKQSDITEFYYTYATSTYPPDYQRYRLFTENGQYYFFHEKREGDHWPLTEADATVTGTIQLTEEEWTRFFGILENGTVIKRQVSADAGDSGPWFYLYWKKDRGEYQEFSFETWDKAGEFEKMCEELASR